MANQIDEVTSLTRAFASASTSETDLYREEKLPGKGVGCIALVEIMKGNLVLRETPQLLHPVSAKRQLIHDDEEYEEEEEEAKHLEFCVNAFMKMSKKDQESYLDLHNKFDTEKDAWSSDMRQKYSEWQNLVVPNISQAKAFKVIAILDTNGFHNGVCLKMSRFNHSCQPNAQYFWNEDSNTRDLRTLRKIDKGEEITVNYISSYLLGREERQTYLKDTYNFDCNCTACDLTEDESSREVENISKYKAEALRRQNLQDSALLVTAGAIAQALLQSEFKCLNSMYQVADQIKSFGPRIQEDINERAFYVAVKGAAGCSKEMEATKKVWLQEANICADIGLKLGTTLNGADHSETKKWNERVANPMAAVEDQQGSRDKAYDLTEVEVEKEIKRIDEYKKETSSKEGFRGQNKNAPNILTMQSELRSLMRMYHIAEKIKTFDKRVFLKEMVAEAFDVSVQGALCAQQSVFTAAAFPVWMEDANKFANIGLQIATEFYGSEHSVTKKWEERCDNPVNFFRREFGGATD